MIFSPHRALFATGPAGTSPPRRNPVPPRERSVRLPAGIDRSTTRRAIVGSFLPCYDTLSFEKIEARRASFPPHPTGISPSDAVADDFPRCETRFVRRCKLLDKRRELLPRCDRLIR